jgi:hypothetical protein
MNQFIQEVKSQLLPSIFLLSQNIVTFFLAKKHKQMQPSRTADAKINVLTGV